MKIKKILVGVLSTNCYILIDESTNAAAIVDPGGNPTKILDQIREDGLDVKAILLTHAHFDHTAGVAGLLDALPDVPVYQHPADAPIKDVPEMHPVEGAVPYEDGDTVQVGTLTVRVLHTPGHTFGGVTLMVENEGVLFTGDTLFRDSIGRTDLVGGDYEAIMKSLARLAALEGDWKVLPGHMGATTLERERQTNYYLIEAARG